MALSTRVPAALATVLLNSAAPAAQADTLQDGKAAYDAGQYGEARQLWLLEARAGDPQAALDVALLYDLGEGVPPSAATAFYWYRRAAEGGLGTAALDVGVMYDSGRGIPLNRAKAAIWYARAAALGQARAAFNLGQLYELGQGVPRNIAAAGAWYGMAAATIPEAAVKAAALAGQHGAAAPGPLAAPTPVWPMAGTPVPSSGAPLAVQLVWTAPPEPRRVTYFVELRARENGQFNEVSASYVATSAVAVTLPDDRNFAWRVYAVAADGSGYAPSRWARFDAPVIRPPGTLPRAAHP